MTGGLQGKILTYSVSGHNLRAYYALIKRLQPIFIVLAIILISNYNIIILHYNTSSQTMTWIV